jgi:hypothetical protein
LLSGVAARLAGATAAARIARIATPRGATPAPVTVRPEPAPAPRSQIATIRAPTLIGIASQPRDETPMWSPRHHRSRIGESSAPKRIPTDPLEVTRIQEAPETEALRDSARVALPGVDESSGDLSRSEPTIPVPPPSPRPPPVVVQPPPAPVRKPTPAPIAATPPKPAPPAPAPIATPRRSAPMPAVTSKPSAPPPPIAPPPIAAAAPIAPPRVAPPPVIAPPPVVAPPPAISFAAAAALSPPREEARAPGAAFKLPANPLSDLGPADLASFVDCTLYEHSSDAEDISISMDEPTRETNPQPPPAPAIPPLPELEVKAIPIKPAPRATAVLPANRRPSLVLRVSEPARKFTARAGIYVACVVVGLVGGRLMLGKPTPASAPVPAASPAVAAQAAPEPVAKPPEPVAKPPASLSAVSVAMAAPPPPRPQPVKPAPSAAPAPEPVPVMLAPPPVAKSALAAAPTPKSDECVARVVSEPDGVQVLWDDKVLGETPLAGAPIPCGPGKLTLRRDRYLPFSRDMKAAPGTVMSVNQRLQRPPATLAIGSSPANAEITINGQPQGVTPKKLTVARYQTATIKVKLDGYETWTKTVYLREAENRIAMQLTRAKQAAK